jgi:hypothetical protein
MSAASTIRRLLGAAVITFAVTSGALAVAQAPVGGDEVTRLVQQVEVLRATHADLTARLAAQRAAFDGIVGEVERLRAERAAAGQLADDTALREGLRRAHESADALRLRSAELRELRAEIGTLEDALVSRIDGRIVALEGQVREARGAELGALVGELNELNELLADYQEPLPEAPVVELDAILLGLGEDVDLDEVLATVDELSDNERRMLDFIAELDEEIGEFERRRTLAERARRAERDSSLFEEGVNSGRGERSRPRTGGGATAADEDVEAGGSPTAGQDDQANNDSDGGAEAPVSSGGDGGSRGGVDEPGGAAGPEFGGDGATSGGGGAAESPDGGFSGGEDDGGIDVDPAAPGDDSSQSGGGVLDGGGGVAEPTTSLPPALSGIQGASTTDPTLLWIGAAPEGGADGRSGAGSRLDDLRAQRDEANQTLEQLRRHRQQLLERVEELQQSDTW